MEWVVIRQTCLDTYLLYVSCSVEGPVLISNPSLCDIPTSGLLGNGILDDKLEGEN